MNFHVRDMIITWNSTPTHARAIYSLGRQRGEVLSSSGNVCNCAMSVKRKANSLLGDPLNLLHMYSLIYCSRRIETGERIANTKCGVSLETISLIPSISSCCSLMWSAWEKKIELHHNLWIHFCIIEFPCYSLMHVFDGCWKKYKKCKRETKKKTWFMPNNILLIFKQRMAEHNAVIYVYCDFNLKLPHSPKRLHVERFVLATCIMKEFMCAMDCAVEVSNSRIDESISLSRRKLTTPQSEAFLVRLPLKAEATPEMHRT